MAIQREMGVWVCTALVVGNVIGMGIFLLPASLAPYGLNALSGWLITLVGCLALAVIFARLATAMPYADGPYAYIRHAFGEVPAFFVMWAFWASAWATETALATGVVGYLRSVFPSLENIHQSVLALGILWFIAVINLRGVRSGGRVQVVTTVLKLMPLLAVIGVGIWVLIHSPGSYTSNVPVAPLTLHGLMAASTLTLYAMLGIESAVLPAARVRDPQRTIPRATIFGTLLTTVVYILVSAVPLFLIKEHELASSNAPLALLVGKFANGEAARWFGLFVVISGVGALNGWTMLNAEVARTMADHGVLPRSLGHRNRFGSPSVALLVNTVFASAFIAMSYNQSLVGAFTFYTRMVTVSELPLYLGCALTLLILWRRGVIAEETVSTLLLVSIATLYACLAFVGAGALPDALLLLLCVIGLPVYAYTRWRRKAQ